jgi:hypothetical protein
MTGDTDKDKAIEDLQKRVAKLETDQRAVFEALLEWFNLDLPEGVDAGFLSIRTAIHGTRKYNQTLRFRNH